LIGGSNDSAVFTSWLSLFGSAYGTRGLYIARKKLGLIEAELNKCGASHHQPTKRDYLIPMTAGLRMTVPDTVQQIPGTMIKIKCER